MKKARHTDDWLFILLCLLVFWAPIPLGSNRLWSISLLQAGYGLIAIFLFSLFARHQLTITSTSRKSALATALFMAIPFWSAVQLLPLPPDWTAITQNTTSTLNRLQAGLWLAMVFALCAQLLNSKQRIRTLAIVIVASGVFQACYGVLTVLGGTDFDIFGIRSPYWKAGSATGTFINRNHLAGHLEMSLAVGTGLMIANFGSGQHSSWRERIRAFLHAILGEKARLRIFLVVMVIALVMTRSRMGNTAFFASMGISSVIGYFLYRRQSRSLVILFASMILIDVLIISTWFGLEKLANRIENTGDAEGRLDVNLNAWEWFKDYWLTGSGSGSFASIFPSYRSSDVTGYYDHAHNDYLQILGEYGIIGSSLFAAIIIYTLWTAIQAQRERRDPLMKGIAFGSMMGVISLMIHSSTDFNIHIPANSALLTILCALAFSSRHLESSPKNGHKKSAHKKEDSQDARNPEKNTPTARQQ